MLEKQWSHSGSPPTTRNICPDVHFFRSNFFWCLKFRIEKKFLSASFRIESSRSFFHQINALDFFLSLTLKEHFAWGVFACLPGGQGEKIMSNEVRGNMTRAGSWWRPGYGMLPPDWPSGHKSITDDTIAAIPSMNELQWPMRREMEVWFDFSLLMKT